MVLIYQKKGKPPILYLHELASRYTQLKIFFFINLFKIKVAEFFFINGSVACRGMSKLERYSIKNENI